MPSTTAAHCHALVARHWLANNCHSLTISIITNFPYAGITRIRCMKTVTKAGVLSLGVFSALMGTP